MGQIALRIAPRMTLASLSGVFGPNSVGLVAYDTKVVKRRLEVRGRASGYSLTAARWAIFLLARMMTRIWDRLA